MFSCNNELNITTQVILNVQHPSVQGILLLAKEGIIQQIHCIGICHFAVTVEVAGLIDGIFLIAEESVVQQVHRVGICHLTVAVHIAGQIGAIAAYNTFSVNEMVARCGADIGLRIGCIAVVALCCLGAVNGAGRIAVRNVVGEAVAKRFAVGEGRSFSFLPLSYTQAIYQQNSHHLLSFRNKFFIPFMIALYNIKSERVGIILCCPF